MQMLKKYWFFCWMAKKIAERVKFEDTQVPLDEVSDISYSFSVSGTTQISRFRLQTRNFNRKQTWRIPAKFLPIFIFSCKLLWEEIWVVRKLKVKKFQPNFSVYSFFFIYFFFLVYSLCVTLTEDTFLLKSALVTVDK